MTSAPRVATVVLNWNNYEDSRDCIRSVKESNYNNQQMIVVDNNSTDNSYQKLKEEFPDITYIGLNRNLGYPGGNNAGIREAISNNAEYIFILNNDTIIPDEGVVQRLTNIMEENKQVGIISPLISYYPETGKIWFSQGCVNTTTGSITHKRMGDRIMSLELPEKLENEYISGCAMFIRKSVFDDIGLLNEEFFMKASDTEFSLRARSAGYKLRTDLGTKVYHKASASSGGEFGLSYYRSRNKLLLYGMIDEFRPTVYPFYLLWLVKSCISAVYNGHQKEVLEFIRGTVDGIRGKSGKRDS